ncbi:MAG: hypothetical protein IJW36_01500 [Clostridia bacterium]|nr:hypothetical protein [Clostridia bacterium]
MKVIKNPIFYEKARTMLADYVKAGGKVEDLTHTSPEYIYIRNTRVYDENGNLMSVEAKFSFLGYPRKEKKSSNLREELIEMIKEYLLSGGSLHIARKKLPFYEKLHSYKLSLKHRGINLTHEEIMKQDLGFKEFSDSYFRCQGVEKLKYFRDENGFVDAYRKHKVFNSYIKELAQAYNVPIYFVTSLLADEKLYQYEISIDKVAFTERLLQNYAVEHGTFVGIKRKDPKVYEAFNYLIKYYSDGTEQKFSKLDWLKIFDLDDIEHRFRDEKKEEALDISNIMLKLKQEYPNQIVMIKDINPIEYRAIVRKAISLGVDIKQVFKMYGMECNGITIPRLSKVWVEEIPYFEEMIKRRDYLINQQLQKLNHKPCKEEIFEFRLSAVMQVYQEYKEKLETYLPEQIFNNNSISQTTDTF